MHRKMLEKATPEQLKSFLYDQFDELKRTMPEIYDDMEMELYEHIYGPHFCDWKYDCAVSSLENEDGTKGPHWTVNQIVDYAKSHGIEFTHFNEWDFAYAVNVMYSDYYGTVPDNAESYFKLAKAFLMDKDAPEGKAFLYYKAMHH